MPENLRILRRKREIVGEIRQITRAMKLVSAAKLKRAIDWRDAVEQYHAELEEAVALVRGAVGAVDHPLLRPRPVQRIGLLLVAGDKGLCGAFNAGVVSAAREFARNTRARMVTITVGARTAEMARRARLNVVREFPAIHRRQLGSDVQDIARYVAGLFQDGEVQQVQACLARFVSRISNEPTVQQVLPLPLPAPRTGGEQLIVEPEAHELLGAMLPEYFEAVIFQVLLNSAASEHSSRLMAMTAATDNAEEMMDELTRDINRARQAEITRELLDVVGGADALEQQR